MRKRASRGLNSAVANPVATITVSAITRPPGVLTDIRPARPCHAQGWSLFEDPHAALGGRLDEAEARSIRIDLRVP